MDKPQEQPISQDFDTETKVDAKQPTVQPGQDHSEGNLHQQERANCNDHLKDLSDEAMTRKMQALSAFFQECDAYAQESNKRIFQYKLQKGYFDIGKVKKPQPPKPASFFEKATGYLTTTFNSKSHNISQDIKSSQHLIFQGQTGQKEKAEKIEKGIRQQRQVNYLDYDVETSANTKQFTAKPCQSHIEGNLLQEKANCNDDISDITDETFIRKMQACSERVESLVAILERQGEMRMMEQLQLKTKKKQVKKPPPKPTSFFEKVTSYLTTLFNNRPQDNTQDIKSSQHLIIGGETKKQVKAEKIKQKVSSHKDLIILSQKIGMISCHNVIYCLNRQLLKRSGGVIDMMIAGQR